MEVKIEPSADQSLMEKYSEICEKYGKLQQDYAELQTKMAEVRNENTELKNEMAINKVIFEQQILMLNEELAKLKGQNQRENLESQQGQNPMMQNNTFNDLSTGEMAENDEFTAQTTMTANAQLDHQQQSQNLIYTFDSAATITIKQEYENDEMVANSPFFQMQTTSTSLSNEEDGDELNGLQFAVDANFAAHNVDGEMDLDENGENEARMEESDTDGQIKYAPTKIGNMFKCNWPECEDQSKGPNSKYKMSSHWRTHSGERPYVCMECGQSFTHLGNLKRHKRIHNDERPYVCPECGKSFKLSGTLANHKRTHTNERPYICSKCGQSFTQLTNLKRHALIHTGEKPYQCDVCGKSCRQKNDLIKHKRTHTDERPFVCEECDKSFKHSKTLKDHKRIHASDSLENLDNSMENANTIIKREYENGEMEANSNFSNANNIIDDFE